MGRRQRNSSPISLFAFQDIITSVTGILILMAVLLTIVMITQKAASVSTAAEAANPDGLEEQILAVQAEIKDLEKRMDSNRQSIGRWAGYSKDQLVSEREALQSSIDAMDLEIQQNQLDIDRLEAAFAQAGKSPEFEKFRAERNKLEDQIEDNLKQLEHLKTSNRVIYNFNRTHRQPWLAQIDSQGIVASKGGSAEPSRRFRSDREFVDFCRALPEAERYVVLIVRPTGIAVQDAVREKLKTIDVDVGVELIGETQTAVDTPLAKEPP